MKSKLPLPMITPQGFYRQPECRPCTACCTVMGEVSLGKPYYIQCKHVCAQGCSIHPNRPQGCQDFFCLWRVGGISNGDPVWRPDNCGYLINLEQDEHGHAWVEIFETESGRLGTMKDGRFYVENNVAIHAGRKTAFTYGCKGIRFYPFGARVGTLFPISKEYPNEGEGGGTENSMRDFWQRSDQLDLLFWAGSMRGT